MRGALDMAAPSIKKYSMQIMSDSPIAYWRMDDLSGNLLDTSGLQRNLTPTGVAYSAAPLVVGGSGIKFSGTASASATINNIFVRGAESNSFTIEVWVKALSTPTVDRLIIGRSTDGLFLTSRGIEFRVTDTNSITARAVYSVGDWSGPLHIVGTYNSGRIFLYVNGELVSGAELTGNFANTSETFMVGGSGVTGGDVVVDEAAIFLNNLPGNRVREHYAAGNKNFDYASFYASAGATYWPLTEKTATVGAEYLEESDEEFFGGTSNNLLIINNKVTLADPSLAGYKITDPIDIDSLQNIAGSYVEWDASDTFISADVSLDLGNTWTPLVNRSAIPGLGAVSTVNKFMQFRINFPVVDQSIYDSYLYKFRAVLFTSKNSQSLNANLPATVSTTVSLASQTYTGIQGNLVGATLNSGYIVLPSLGTGRSINALEFWVKRNQNTGSTAYIFDTRPNGTAYMSITAASAYSGAGMSTVYVNGQQRTPTGADFSIGSWTHLFVIFQTPFEGPVTLGATTGLINPGQISIAHVAEYTRTPTASEVLAHYQNGYSEEVLTKLDSSLVLAFDGEVKLFGYAWQNVG